MPGAKAAYQQAIDSRTRAAPTASVDLGGLLGEEGGCADGAKAAYQQAIDSEHASGAAGQPRDLGLLLLKDEKERCAVGAKEAFQQAIDSEHANAAGLASLILGILLAAQGVYAGCLGSHR